MPGIASVGLDAAGGTQLGGGQSFVKCEGAIVVLLGDPVASHGLPPHASPTLAQGSSFVRINGVPVCRAGSGGFVSALSMTRAAMEIAIFAVVLSTVLDGENLSKANALGDEMLSAKAGPIVVPEHTLNIDKNANNSDNSRLADTLHTGGVTGSIPVAPTRNISRINKLHALTASVDRQFRCWEAHGKHRNVTRA
ncbi:MAG: hypothetical protein ACKVP7_13500 [Hyphomicrobiaceae bacterium]